MPLVQKPVPVATRRITTLVVTIPQAAEMLGTSRWTVDGMVARSELPTVLVGKRRMVLVEDVEAYLRKTRAFGRQETAYQKRTA